MKNPILIIVFLFSTLFSFSQQMRPVEQLINTSQPGWPIVQGWIKQAKNKVEILPVDSAKARQALYYSQVKSRSPMGAIIYSTGGIMVDDGWIHILGSGSERLSRNLPEWNKGKSFKEYGEAPSFYLVADDASGGFFAINGGALGKDKGKIYYLSPSSLEWESLNLTYSEFLLFCFSGDLEKFYADCRWKDWRTDVKGISGDKVFNSVPPLWSKEGKDRKKVSRAALPIEEQYLLYMEFINQMKK